MVVVVIVLVVALVVAIAGLVVSRRRLAALIRATTPSPAATLSDVPEPLGGREHSDAGVVLSIGAHGPDSDENTATASTPVVDAALLWAMERARSERTWRYSVALGPDSVSVFSTTANVLLAALQVEVDAAREEVGTVVELDSDVPSPVGDDVALLTLRFAQELLAPGVRLGERVRLRVRCDGSDIVITVTSVDEHDHDVQLQPIELPLTGNVEAIDGGVRLRNVIDPPPSTEEPGREGTP